MEPENSLQNEIYSETVRSPSKGLLYSAESPLYKKDSLEIRPMTALEEDILTSRNLIKKGTALDTLMRSCLVDKTIDPTEMYSFDRNALAIAIRACSYGSDYEVKIECPFEGCESKFPHTFDLSKLEYIFFDESVKHHNGEFDFILPSSKKKLKFKFLTGRDEQRLIESAKASNKNMSLGDITHLVSGKWIEQITEFEGNKNKTEFAHSIRKMLARDSAALRNYIDDIMPGLILDFDIKCPRCENEFEISLPMEKNFFWPDSIR